MLQLSRMAVAVFAATSVATFAQTADVKPLNDLPNPFRTVRDWGAPPGGVPWAESIEVRSNRVACNAGARPTQSAASSEIAEQ